MENGFYQKNGYAVRMISRDFLTMEVGDRISPIDEYALRLSVSRWVIQVALSYLEDQGCVGLEKRGVLGTYIASMNMDRLWEVADLSPLMGLLPFPTCALQDSLLTGLIEAFRLKDTPVMTAFLPTSGSRFLYLEKDLCHFVLCSGLAAKSQLDRHPDLEICSSLPDARCGMPYILATSDPDIRQVSDGMSICIHRNSIEQMYILEKLSENHDLKVIWGNYQEQIELFSSGKTDLYLSRGDEDLRMFPVNSFNQISLDYLGVTEDMTTPVIIVKKSPYDMKRIILKRLDIDSIGRIQKEVLARKLPAKYL